MLTQPHTTFMQFHSVRTFFFFPLHRVDRVPSFFSSRPNWDFPTPSPAGEHVPPLVRRGGEGVHSAHWLAGEKVGGPISTREQTLWYSRYILYQRLIFKVLKPVVKFIDSDCGDKVNSGIGLSYRPARLYIYIYYLGWRVRTTTLRRSQLYPPVSWLQ
jgi:hypothetical protein